MSYQLTMRDSVLTAPLSNAFQVIRKNQARIIVRPPHFQPLDFPTEGIDTNVQRQSKPLPFVMLVYAPDIVDTGGPELLALILAFAPRSHKIWFVTPTPLFNNSSVSELSVMHVINILEFSP